MPYNTDKIMNSFNKFFEENQNYSRKELLEFAKKAYDDNYKKSKKVIDENAEKKPLNSYQIFMKEQRVILNKRENERTDGEKKKSTELMKEIAEMWKLQKTRIEKKEDNKPIENEYDKQKELLLQQITNINTLYSKYNGDFLGELSQFTKNYEERRKIKLGQLLTEVSSNLEEQNEENSGKSSIISDIPRTEEAI